MNLADETETLTEQNFSLPDFIAQIESDIFDETIWIQQKMRKIAEITYSYTKIPKEKWDYYLNYTLFCEIGGLDVDMFKNIESTTEQQKLILEASRKVTEKIDTKTEHINNYLKVIRKQKKNEELDIITSNSLEIIENALKEKLHFFNYCLIGLPYEIEKACGYFSGNIKEIDEKLEKLDKQLFWEKVMDTPSEVALCYEELVSDYLKYFHKLTEREQILYEGFLHKVELYLPKSYSFTQKKSPKNLLKQFKNYKLEDSRYIPGFNFFIESLQGLEHIAVQNDEAGSISDGPNSIEFPTSKKFKELDLARILKLNIHEIETHSITDHNHRQLLGNIRWAKSIEKDEGLAMFMENILQYGNKLLTYDPETDTVVYDIRKFDLPASLTYTLIWELFDNKRLIEFLQLENKLKGAKITPEARFRRLKRSNKNRVQYKDSSYARGLIKVVQHINEHIISDGEQGIPPEHLFLGKISFEETQKLYEIKKERQKQEENFYVLTPLFTSDAVIYSIECKKKGIPVYEESFLAYLEKKYPFFTFKEKKIKTISHSIKRNVTSVVHIFLDKMNEETTLNHDENFILMLQNSTRKLSEKRRAIVEKYIGSETN